MPPLRRRIARKRLRNTNEVVRSIEVGFPGEAIRIVLDADRYTAPASGRVVEVRLSDGERVRVAHRLRQGRLVQRFIGSDGVRTDIFVVSDDGRRLMMHVLLESDRLSAPIRYRVPYVRR